MTKKPNPDCCGAGMLEIITVPKAKMLERKCEDSKPLPKDQERVLKERSRRHSRNVELADIIEKVGNQEIIDKYVKKSGYKIIALL